MMYIAPHILYILIVFNNTPQGWVPSLTVYTDHNTCLTMLERTKLIDTYAGGSCEEYVYTEGNQK